MEGMEGMETCAQIVEGLGHQARNVEILQAEGFL